MLVVEFAGTGAHARLGLAKAAAPRVAIADLSENPAAWPALFDGFFTS